MISRFFSDVVRGLTARSKHLDSKYFYDKDGDQLFERIMALPEYYLTRCELEIFTKQSDELADIFLQQYGGFDVVELGAGDATKSIHLLKQIASKGVEFTYYPIDISKNVITNLEQKLSNQISRMHFYGMNGEYFEMLEKVKDLSSRKKVVLFLGSTIGNIPLEDLVWFLKELHSHLIPGDMLLIGFDLKKDPQVILNAYNDKEGLTRQFNLNLLKRINRELGADFDIESFDHYPIYDPMTGACKSYLISKKAQQVFIGDTEVITFSEQEPIYMEIAQKYAPEQTDGFAKEAGFRPVKHFFDSKHWFMDALWKVNGY